MSHLHAHLLLSSLTLGAHSQRGLQYLVCLSVCFSYSGSTRDDKYNERYHRVKRQICGNIKIVFFLKLSYSKDRAFFTYLGRGSHL